MLISEVVQEGVNDPHIFKAVFMAGGPGSGKSTVARNLFAGTGLREVNIDKFWNLFHKKGKEKDFDQLHRRHRISRDMYTRGRLGLLIDGTGRNVRRISALKEELEDLGYETAMVFVNTDLETAVNRAQDRVNKPGPDQGRSVDQDFMKQAWKQSQDNIGHFQNLFSGNLFVVDNSGETPGVDFAEKKLRQWLNQPVRNEKARNWIKQQRQDIS